MFWPPVPVVWLVCVGVFFLVFFIVVVVGCVHTHITGVIKEVAFFVFWRFLMMLFAACSSNPPGTNSPGPPGHPPMHEEQTGEDRIQKKTTFLATIPQKPSQDKPKSIFCHNLCDRFLLLPVNVSAFGPEKSSPTQSPVHSPPIYMLMRQPLSSNRNKQNIVKSCCQTTVNCIKATFFIILPPPPPPSS